MSVRSSTHFPANCALAFFARGRVDLASEHVDLLELGGGVPGVFFEHLVRVAHAGEITRSVDRILILSAVN